MRYAVKRADGGVSVMQALPIAVRIGDADFTASRIMGGDLYRDGHPHDPIKLPVPLADLKPDSIPGMTIVFSAPEAIIAEWHENDRAAVVSVHAVEGADIPADRTYRNAWAFDGKAVVHDVEKARAIHKDRLREMRAPKMAALDIEYQRADERGDGAAKADIAKRKQALRDVTADPAVAAARTIEELQAAIPAALKD